MFDVDSVRLIRWGLSLALLVVGYGLFFRFYGLVDAWEFRALVVFGAVPLLTVGTWKVVGANPWNGFGERGE